MRSEFRLCSGILGFITATGKPERKLYLACAEKPIYRKKVEELVLTETYQIVTLTSIQFNVKVSENLKVLVLSNKLPEPTEWYEIGNLVTDLAAIGAMIAQLPSEKGNFGDILFDPAFSETYPTQVKLVARGMSEYRKAMSEMLRRINVAGTKKTKTLIPGHRYDTVEGTVYYLGEFLSRRSVLADSDYSKDLASCTPYHFFVDDINPDTEKTISDVLKNRLYGSLEDDIRTLSKAAPMVDGGEVLINDSVNLKSIWLEQINMASKKDASFKSILDFLGFESLSSTEKDTVSNELIEELKTRTEDLMLDCILMYWKVPARGDLSLAGEQSHEVNMDNLVRRFMMELRDGNVQRINYYQNLYQAFGLDLKAIASDILDLWRDDYVFESFDNFNKYSETYFTLRQDIGSYQSRQRISSTNHKLEVTTLKELFPTSPNLLKVLIEILGLAIENKGMVVSHFSCINIGTQRAPLKYYDISMTYSDLVKYLKGDSRLTETLKREIIDSKFSKLSIAIDIDKDIQ